MLAVEIETDDMPPMAMVMTAITFVGCLLIATTIAAMISNGRVLQANGEVLWVIELAEAEYEAGMLEQASERVAKAIMMNNPTHNDRAIELRNSNWASRPAWRRASKVAGLVQPGPE